jgi:DNA anti-recombination protein RmuC
LEEAVRERDAALQRVHDLQKEVAELNVKKARLIVLASCGFFDWIFLVSDHQSKAENDAASERHEKGILDEELKTLRNTMQVEASSKDVQIKTLQEQLSGSRRELEDARRRARDEADDLRQRLVDQ